MLQGLAGFRGGARLPSRAPGHAIRSGHTGWLRRACMRRRGHARRQVVVHNLPWNCTWQNLKDAFAENTQNIERADVITDSTGRSRRAPSQRRHSPLHLTYRWVCTPGVAMA